MTVNSNNNSPLLDYYVDIVMCIDATGGMAPIIEEVKKNVLSFYPKLVEAMESQIPSKQVTQLRIKVITFRDYGMDDEPMVESEFFDLFDENDAEQFKDYVNAIEAKGGGDAPENALEALALAMKSDWSREPGAIHRHYIAIHRHYIVMFTDAPASPLGARAGESGYPTDMPKDLAELQEMWDKDMELRAKRLVIFAPECQPWSEMIDWTNTVHIACKADYGLSDIDIEIYIEMLANSV